jgi:hypothetical protein
VSIAYNKPAKTGSTTVGHFLKHTFPEAKRVQCGLHSEKTSLDLLLKPENSGFDFFDCHSIWNATMISALAKQAKHPVVHVTTIRDPIEQAISLFFHVRRGVCGSSNVPTADEVFSFVKDAYVPRIHSFYSRPYSQSEIGAKVAREECAYWDVIWRTDKLKAALDSDIQVNTLTNAKRKCKEKDAIWSNSDLMQKLEELLATSREMYEGMKRCHKVTSEDPRFKWDEEQRCIIMT